MELLVQSLCFAVGVLGPSERDGEAEAPSRPLWTPPWVAMLCSGGSSQGCRAQGVHHPEESLPAEKVEFKGEGGRVLSETEADTCWYLFRAPCVGQAERTGLGPVALRLAGTNPHPRPLLCQVVFTGPDHAALVQLSRERA